MSAADSPIRLPWGSGLEARLVEVEGGTDLALWRSTGPVGEFERTAAGLRVPDALLRLLIEGLLRREKQLKRRGEASLWAQAPGSAE